jgi:hypothetical protein
MPVLRPIVLGILPSGLIRKGPLLLVHILISGGSSVNQGCRRPSQAIQWFATVPACKDVS